MVAGLADELYFGDLCNGDVSRRIARILDLLYRVCKGAINNEGWIRELQNALGNGLADADAGDRSDSRVIGRVKGDCANLV